MTLRRRRSPAPLRRVPSSPAGRGARRAACCHSAAAATAAAAARRKTYIGWRMCIKKRRMKRGNRRVQAPVTCPSNVQTVAVYETQTAGQEIMLSASGRKTSLDYSYGNVAPSLCEGQHRTDDCVCLADHPCRRSSRRSRHLSRDLLGRSRSGECFFREEARTPALTERTSPHQGSTPARRPKREDPLPYVS